MATLENASYTYSNNLNQITSHTDSVSGKSVSYTYDLNGNRTGRSADLNGDTVIDEVTTYSYDFENRLLGHDKNAGDGAGLYKYGYDYRTRRVLRDESGAGGGIAHVVFSGGTSVLEYDLLDDSAPQGDADNNGFSNLFEYVLGSDPSSSASTPYGQLGSITEAGETFLTYTFDRRTDDPALDYKLEYSTNLTTWQIDPQPVVVGTGMTQ